MSFGMTKCLPLTPAGIHSSSWREGKTQASNADMLPVILLLLKTNNRASQLLSSCWQRWNWNHDNILRCRIQYMMENTWTLQTTSAYHIYVAWIRLTNRRKKAFTHLNTCPRYFLGMVATLPSKQAMVEKFRGHPKQFYANHRVHKLVSAQLKRFKCNNELKKT